MSLQHSKHTYYPSDRSPTAMNDVTNGKRAGRPHWETAQWVTAQWGELKEGLHNTEGDRTLR
eukprot:7467159-Heterocapsa_arctica.AAC.1